MELANTFLATFRQKETQRFKLKTGVFLFLVQDNQILLLRRYKTGIDDGNYLVPMGAIDGNETLTQAIVREAKEEAGIMLDPNSLRVCHLMHRYHVMPENLSFEQIDVFFYAEQYAGTICNQELDKCSELQFYPLDNLPVNTVPFIRQAIECMRKQQFYSEFGW